MIRWPDSGLEPREVMWLITHLPPGCAFHAAMQGGPEHRAWSTDTYLLAAAVDVLAAANYQRGGAQGQKPKPIPRPGKKKKEGRSLGSLIPRRRP